MSVLEADFSFVFEGLLVVVGVVGISSFFGFDIFALMSI
jgi:hypothetical protein